MIINGPNLNLQGKRTADTSDPFEWKGEMLYLFDTKKEGNMVMGYRKNARYKDYQTRETLYVPEAVFDFLKLWITISIVILKTKKKKKI